MRSHLYELFKTLKTFNVLNCFFYSVETHNLNLGGKNTKIYFSFIFLRNGLILFNNELKSNN